MDRQEPFEFDLSRRPLEPGERAVLAADLQGLGLDDAVLGLLDATLTVATSHSIPLLLRGYRAGALAGAAWVVECRRPMGSLFSGAIARVGNSVGRPLAYWGRFGAGTDLTANPGFVAAGVSRAAFADAARSFLARRYVAVMSVEEGGASAAHGAVVTPFVDFGVLDVAGDGAELLLSRHAHLRRKLRRFEQHGGSVSIVRGSLDPATARGALACLASLQPRFVLPWQDLYRPQVAALVTREDERILHLVARLDGEVAGYQTYLDCGRALHLLNGAFDRRRRTTWHAYERLLVTSAELAADLGRSSLEYGPVVNETKAAMLTRFHRCHLRVEARRRPVRGAMGRLLGHSRLAPARVAPFAGVGE